MILRILSILALSVAGMATVANAAPDRPGPDARSEVPIREVVLPDGVRRYAVTLTVGGQPIEAELDTGSTGLRVLAAALPDPIASARGPSTRYSYGSGVELRGSRVAAPLAIGAATGTASIERVDAVACTDRQPDCPARKTVPGQYRIGGDGLAGQGFAAIVGVGMRADMVGNPLIALGVSRWIVELPHGAKAGRLVLNPGVDEIARYRSFAILGDSNQIAACLVRVADSKRICGPAMVDTGANGLRVQGGARGEMWADGTPAVVALGDTKGLAEFPVTIGRRDQASGMFAEPLRAGSTAITLNLGLAPFFHWSVLFDAGARQIGVADL